MSYFKYFQSFPCFWLALCVISLIGDNAFLIKVLNCFLAFKLIGILDLLLLFDLTGFLETDGDLKY